MYIILVNYQTPTKNGHCIPVNCHAQACLGNVALAMTDHFKMTLLLNWQLKFKQNVEVSQEINTLFFKFQLFDLIVICSISVPDKETFQQKLQRK